MGLGVVFLFFGVVVVLFPEVFAVGFFVAVYFAEGFLTGRLDVGVVLLVVVFVLFAFAFGVVVSFAVFFFSAAAVFETLELSFRLVLEEVDEVLLRERVEDAFLGVFWIPLDDELSFAFLGDINHEIE